HHQPPDKPQQRPFTVLGESHWFRSFADLASRIPRWLANLPGRIVFTCVAVGVSHSVAPDHASRHRPYSVLLVLSRFNNAGLSPALISAHWRTRGGACASQGVASNAPPGPLGDRTLPPGMRIMLQFPYGTPHHSLRPFLRRQRAVAHRIWKVLSRGRGKAEEARAIQQ